MKFELNSIIHSFLNRSINIIMESSYNGITGRLVNGEEFESVP